MESNSFLALLCFEVALSGLTCMSFLWKKTTCASCTRQQSLWQRKGVLFQEICKPHETAAVSVGQLGGITGCKRGTT